MLTLMALADYCWDLLYLNISTLSYQDADIEEMFAFADTDGDGSLSFQEFEVA